MPASPTAPQADRYYRIELKRVRRALARPLLTGGQSIAVRESVLLKLTAEDNPTCTGYGEAATLPWFGTESAEAAANALARLGSRLCIPLPEQEALDTRAYKVAHGQPLAQGNVAAPFSDALQQTLGKELREIMQNAPCARWALESALRQAQALPCAQPRRIAIAALLPQLAESIPAELLAAGFTAFKLKIGVAPYPSEIARVTRLLDSIRESDARWLGGQCEQTADGRYEQVTNEPTPLPQHSTGKAAQHSQPPQQGSQQSQPLQHSQLPQRSQRLRLRLDANGSLSAEALQAWLHHLAPFAEHVDFIEQPFEVGLEAETAAAFAGSPLAFAFDESLTSLPRLLRIATGFPQAVLVVKPSLLGSAEGYLRWRANAGRNARVVYSSALETGIGQYHALSLAAADPQPLAPVGFGTGSLFANDGLGTPPQGAETLAHPHAADMAEARAKAATAAHATPSQTTTTRAAMEAIWKQA